MRLHLVTIGLLITCSRQSDARRVISDDTGHVAVATAADSCASLDTLAHGQNSALAPGESIPPRHPGSWSETRRVSAGAFTLDVPKLTAIGRTDSAHVAMYGFPDCRFFCSLSVTLVQDSADQSLDAYVAGLRPGRSPPDPDQDSDSRGAPQPLYVGQEPAVIMEMPCGDCTSREVVTRRGRRVARIDFGIDDRDGFQPGIMCRLTRVATTFRWADAHAGIALGSPDQH
jgi:hypothetical protein